jgi:hypothetical protein
VLFFWAASLRSVAGCPFLAVVGIAYTRHTAGLPLSWGLLHSAPADRTIQQAEGRRTTQMNDFPRACAYWRTGDVSREAGTHVMLEVLMFGGQVSPSSLNPQLTRHYLHQRGAEPLDDKEIGPLVRLFQQFPKGRSQQ